MNVRRLKKVLDNLPEDMMDLEVRVAELEDILETVNRGPWLLRKQAEAVDEAINVCAWRHDRVWMRIDDLRDHVQTLRQQADKLERRDYEHTQ